MFEKNINGKNFYVTKSVYGKVYQIISKNFRTPKAAACVIPCHKKRNDGLEMLC